MTRGGWCWGMQRLSSGTGRSSLSGCAADQALTHPEAVRCAVGAVRRWPTPVPARSGKPRSSAYSGEQQGKRM
jgi:hypothetical protein